MRCWASLDRSTLFEHPLHKQSLSETKAIETDREIDRKRKKRKRTDEKHAIFNDVLRKRKAANARIRCYGIDNEHTSNAANNRGDSWKPSPELCRSHFVVRPTGCVADAAPDRSERRWPTRRLYNESPRGMKKKAFAAWMPQLSGHTVLGDRLLA